MKKRPQLNLPFSEDDCPECPEIKRPRSMFDITMSDPQVMEDFRHLTGKLGMSPFEAIGLCARMQQQREIVRNFEEGRPTEIKYKLDMYDLFERGLFGNRQVIYPIADAKRWVDTAEEFYENGEWILDWEPAFQPPHKLWALRYKVPNHRKWSCYDLHPFAVWGKYLTWIGEGANKDLFNLTPMMPDDKIIIQGEISRSDQFGWMFRLSTMPRPMNISLRDDPIHINGPGGWLHLKGTMDAQSYSDIQELFETYPDATVEFSTYSINVGDCPGRNTLIWEVRNY